MTDIFEVKCAILQNRNFRHHFPECYSYGIYGSCDWLMKNVPMSKEQLTSSIAAHIHPESPSVDMQLPTRLMEMLMDIFLIDKFANWNTSIIIHE